MMQLHEALATLIAFAVAPKAIKRAAIRRRRPALPDAHRRRGSAGAIGYGRFRPYGLQAGDLRILWRLIDARGSVVTYDLLIDALYAAREDGGPLTAKHVAQNCVGVLNRALAPHNGGRRVIENHYQLGYALPASAVIPTEWRPG
jgi:DNA-binding response OmpR family regulator